MMLEHVVFNFDVAQSMPVSQGEYKMALKSASVMVQVDFVAQMLEVLWGRIVKLASVLISLSFKPMP